MIMVNVSYRLCRVQNRGRSFIMVKLIQMSSECVIGLYNIQDVLILSPLGCKSPDWFSFRHSKG